MIFWDRVKAMRANGRPLTVAKTTETTETAKDAPKKKTTKTAKKAVSENDSGTDTNA